MAEEELDQLEGGEPMAPPEDTGKSLTSALVLVTFAMGLLAFIMMEVALGKYFGVGLFKG